MTRCYAWPVTVGPSDELQLHLSTTFPSVRVWLYRAGADVEAVASPAGPLAGLDVPFGRPDAAWGWPRHSISLPPELADGIYIAVVVAAGEPAPEAGADLLTRTDACLFVLRRRPADRPGRRIWVKLP